MADEAWYVAAGGAAVAIIGAAAKGLHLLWQGEYDRGRTSRSDRRDEFKVLLDRQQVQIDGLQEREDSCREDLAKLSRRYERLAVWVLYLQDELTRANIKFRPWADPDTAEHQALGSGS